MPTRIGLISDTHGLIRPAVAEAFRGVELILHAGDVGTLDVLHELRTIATVHAVFGNVDDPWTPALAETQRVTIEGWSVVVTHGHRLRRLTAAALLALHDERIVVYGHTHRAALHRAEGRLVINPGAAGPRRFDVVPSVALLELAPDRAEVEHVPLD